MRLLFLILLFCVHSLTASQDWIRKQITEDLNAFSTPFCAGCLKKFFSQHHAEYQLCIFEIRPNKVLYRLPSNIPLSNGRFRAIYSALSKLREKFRLPSVTILVSLHDALNASCSVPVFVMSKTRGDNKILFPDCEALVTNYQVLPGIDLETTHFPIPWKERKDQLIWRGSGAQGQITKENMHTKNRIILCQLSHEFPDLIDAGLTFCIPACVSHYYKPTISFTDIFAYRYQIWLDGNAASYSNSGWRLLTGSTVIKPDSPYIQWYYNDLVPWVDYVPVREDLANLVETLLFLKDNEAIAETIAQNGIQFAREHITPHYNDLYLRHLLMAYAARCALCPEHKKHTK